MVVSRGRGASDLVAGPRVAYRERMTEGRFWFNVRTGQVEELDRKGQSKDLLGPYATRREAQQALEQARARTRLWDESDRRWETGEED